MDPIAHVERQRRQADLEARARALVDHLGHFVNGMSHDQADAFATALANEHPTLLGQIAKAVGIGVMRRATYTPWRPFDGYERMCPLSTATEQGVEVRLSGSTAHAAHDGRLDCTTVIGAELTARQSYV